MKRRDFLKVGAAGAALATSGCGKIRAKIGDWLGGGGVPDAFSVAAGAETDDRVHLLNRAAFGPWPGDLERVTKLGADGWIEEQLNPDAINDFACGMRSGIFESLRMKPGDMYEFKKHVVEEELTRYTVLQAVYSKRQLYEVMVEFWTDHFNIHIGKADCAWLLAPDQRDTIRAHALGNFRDLVRTSALSPAMLVYLDGRENRKRKPDERPNENYARELLELHTLGVHGGYTQKDVMEVARCLTGWTCRKEGQWRKGRVEFHARAHDDGEKTVLGHTIPAGLREKDLDRVLEIVCGHPSTALYLAEKLCRRFIQDAPPAAIVARAAGEFTKSQGDIKATLRTILKSPEFRAAKGRKFKRPFRYVVSALRAVGAETEAKVPLLRFLEAMGHAPFQHPTPDGYPDEQTPWLGTLMWRWNFAMALASNGIGGTSVDVGGLTKAMGAPAGQEADWFLRHALGREGLPLEKETLKEFGSGASEPWRRRTEALGLVLASPAFQIC